MLLIPPYLVYVRAVAAVHRVLQPVRQHRRCARCGVARQRRTRITVSTVELSEMIAESVSEGLLDREEHTRLTRALQIRNRMVADVAVPRRRDPGGAGRRGGLGADGRRRRKSAWPQRVTPGSRWSRSTAASSATCTSRTCCRWATIREAVVDLSRVRPLPRVLAIAASARCAGADAPHQQPSRAGHRTRRRAVVPWSRWRTWWRTWSAPCATGRTVSEVRLAGCSPSEWTAARRRTPSGPSGSSRRTASAHGRGEAHPVWDFLFTYYSLRPRQLLRWHPGYGVTLAGGAAATASWAAPAMTRRARASRSSREYLRGRAGHRRFVAELLRATAARPAQLNCFGMHEWAMVYRSDEVRHAQVPLRLGPQAPTGWWSVAVALQPLRRVPLLHRRSGAAQRERADPRNARSPGTAGLRARQHGFVQVVLQAGPAGRLRDAARLPGAGRAAREIDMRASPYDLSDYGYHPDPCRGAGRPGRIRALPEGHRGTARRHCEQRCNAV